MNERETIQAAKQGDVAAFNRLVMAHQGLAYNVAFRLMGDADAAADATQEAFLKAFRAIGQYRGGSFKSWLLRIVTNACYDQLRYHQRRPTEPLLPETNDDGTPAEHAARLMDSAESPEDFALRRELNEMLQQAILRLPPDQRLILVLSDAEGFGYREIADITGLPLGTVKSRLSRARSRLRDLLQEQELLPSQYRL
ncbi:MAG: sigma-70 family RNA polymerase sigma factor [Caldilineae bacterium]|nr:MAG: sigma-70 family RNA polymerase sigma factor [Caldilineae bacterium]